MTEHTATGGPGTGGVRAVLPGGIGGAGHAIVLMGAPGAGKSTVGAILARRLGFEFVDVDAVIEQREGRPIGEIFVDDGEAWFRALERDVTLEMLRRGGVVSLGGGAVLNPDIRAAMLGHTVVWLRVSITQATRRVGMNTLRPLLLGNVRSRLVTLLRERTPLYEQCATLVVDTDNLKARVVAREIIERLGGTLSGTDVPDRDDHEPDDHEPDQQQHPPARDAGHPG